MMMDILTVFIFLIVVFLLYAFMYYFAHFFVALLFNEENKKTNKEIVLDLFPKKLRNEKEKVFWQHFFEDRKKEGLKGIVHFDESEIIISYKERVTYHLFRETDFLICEDIDYDGCSINTDKLYKWNEERKSFILIDKCVQGLGFSTFKYFNDKYNFT